MGKKLHFLFLALTLLFFGLFFLLPVGEILRGGLTDGRGKTTLFFLAETFRNPLYRDGLLNSFLVAGGTTLLSLALSLPLAWLSSQYRFWGSRLWNGLLLMPMILAPFVGALGMQAILGRYGALNQLLLRLGILAPGGEPDWLAGGMGAVILLEALHLHPILYLNLTAAFANVDPALLEAAEDCGCTGFRRFRTITLPLIRPGLFAGCTLVFIWSFTELGTPLMFNYERLTPVQIFLGISEMGHNPMPYALVTVMMVASLAAYLLAKFRYGRENYAMWGKAGRAVSPVPLRGVGNFLAGLAFALVSFAGILPHLGVAGLALGKGWYRSVLPLHGTWEHLETALGHNLTVPSILNSLRYCALALVLALALGIFIAWAVERGRHRGGWLLDALAMLPLAVPGLVVAFGYLAMTARGRLLHALNPVENPTALLVISYAIRRIPYVVRAAVAGLQQTSVAFEEAAASLGASGTTIFRRITVPLISANLLAGAILTFSFSMLEVSDSLLLAQKAEFYPITKAIYDLSSFLGEGASVAAALGLWTMLFLGASYLLAASLLGKKMGAIFRG